MKMLLLAAQIKAEKNRDEPSTHGVCAEEMKNIYVDDVKRNGH